MTKVCGIPTTSDAAPAPLQAPEPLDDKKIAYRKAQVELGKQTAGYKAYLAAVPKEARNPHRKYGKHPVTPDAHEEMGKKRWTGLVSAWRRSLHAWDPDQE